jgi:hypothetical protein
MFYPKIGTSSIDWAQLSRFYLKTDTEPRLLDAVLKHKQVSVFRKRQNDGYPETKYFSLCN